MGLGMDALNMYLGMDALQDQEERKVTRMDDYPKSIWEKLNDPQLLDCCHGSKAMLWGAVAWGVFGLILVALMSIGWL